MNIAKAAERNGDVELPIGQPLISTVIPTYNRVERLNGCSTASMRRRGWPRSAPR